VTLLSHPSTGAFLSHCWWNSTLESVKHGVPIIGRPMEGERFGNCYRCLGWERVGIVVVNQRRDVVLPAYENLYKDSVEKHDTLLSGHSSNIKLIDDKRAFLKQLEPQKKVKCLRFSIHT
ncbi:UDP-glycosyltransferase 92A1, partial [Tanacetum coccineum]